MMLATSSELQNEMQKILEKELELNGIRLENRQWLTSKSVLAELSFIVAYEPHEGIIPPFGVMFVEVVAELLGVSFVLIPLEQIDMARKFANGIDCFLIYEKDIFFGLIFFSEPLWNELLLVRSFPPSGGMFVQRGASGQIKFFQGGSIIILENRNWYTKPLIKESAWKISRCVFEIDYNVLNSILEFAFHLLSPIPQVGATIVWWLTEFPINNHDLLSTGKDVSDFNFSILDEAHANVYCHFFSQIDGATFINSNGDFFRTGVHLKNSNRSREIIPEHKGTRHTSAQRFSFDFSETLVITVSSDGPVTIFSDGVSIAKLKIHPSHKAAHDLKKQYPEEVEKISNYSYEHICHCCGKRLIVEQVNFSGHNKMIDVHCFVCNAVVLNETCYYVETRPFKRLKEYTEVMNEKRF